MVDIMRDNGLMISIMVWVYQLQVIQDLKEHLLMVRRMEKENKYGIIDNNMMDNGQIIICMEKGINFNLIK